MPLDNPLLGVSVTDLKARTSAKWTRYEPDVLPLWVAEMDVNLAEPIAKALGGALTTSDTGYPGVHGLAEAFVGFANRHWSWPGLSVADVAPAASVIAGYVDALVLAAGAGGTVIITSPVYPPFTSYVREAGLNVVEAPLDAHMRLDLDAIDAALATAGTRTAILLCNPHNPGGTVHTRAELEALAHVVTTRGARVVSDEIHAPLVYSDAQFVPYLDVDPSAVALHAASKAFNLAALPAALMVFGPEASDLRAQYRSGVHHGPSFWGVIAQEAAYNHGDEWLAALLAGLEQSRGHLGDLLAAQLPSVGYTPPQGTYLAWLDFRHLGLGDDPAAFLLDKARVAVNSGPSFGLGGAGHVRINFATRPEILDDAIARIAAAVASI